MLKAECRTIMGEIINNKDVKLIIVAQSANRLAAAGTAAPSPSTTRQ